MHEESNRAISRMLAKDEMRDRSFDPLDYETYGISTEEARRAALEDRTLTVKSLKKMGYETKCWTLTGQLRKYSSFGNPCGRVRNVYYITIREKKA